MESVKYRIRNHEGKYLLGKGNKEFDDFGSLFTYSEAEMRVNQFFKKKLAQYMVWDRDLQKRRPKKSADEGYYKTKRLQPSDKILEKLLGLELVKVEIADGESIRAIELAGKENMWVEQLFEIVDPTDLVRYNERRANKENRKRD